jgi:hypothetical protein
MCGVNSGHWTFTDLSIQKRGHLSFNGKREILDFCRVLLTERLEERLLAKSVNVMELAKPMNAVTGQQNHFVASIDQPAAEHFNRPSISYCTLASDAT